MNSLGIAGLTALFVGIGTYEIAWGHGFEIHLQDGEIEIKVEPDESLVNLGPRVFVESLTDVGDGQLFSMDGGVERHEGSGFGNDNAFRIDLVGRLWFSSGGPALPAGTQSLTATDATGNLTAMLDGNSNGAVGFPITAADSDEIGWTITDPSASPPVPGVFGWLYVVGGTDVDATPYESSQPVVVALHTEDFTNPVEIERAATAIRNAALMPAAGDFDANGAVEVADYQWWRERYGSAAALSADGNGDGIVGAADYVVWRNAVAAGGGAAASVPEPGSPLLASLLLVAGCLIRPPRPGVRRHDSGLLLRWVVLHNAGYRSWQRSSHLDVRSRRRSSPLS